MIFLKKVVHINIFIAVMIALPACAAVHIKVKNNNAVTNLSGPASDKSTVPAFLYIRSDVQGLDSYTPFFIDSMTISRLPESRGDNDSLWATWNDNVEPALINESEGIIDTTKKVHKEH